MSFSAVHRLQQAFGRQGTVRSPGLGMHDSDADSSATQPLASTDSGSITKAGGAHQPPTISIVATTAVAGLPLRCKPTGVPAPYAAPVAATAPSTSLASGSPHFAGWQAEEQMSGSWGGCSTFSSAQPGDVGSRPCSAGSAQPWSTGGMRPGTAAGSRPCSAPAPPAHTFQYSVRGGGIEEVARSGSAAAESAGGRETASWSGGYAGSGSLGAWAAAGRGDSCSEPAQLEGEPSAPPMSSEPWAAAAADDAAFADGAGHCTQSTGVPLARPWSAPYPALGSSPHGSYGSSASSPRQPGPPYGPTWGAVGSAVPVVPSAAGDAAGERCPSDGQAGQPAVDGRSSERRISEETNRHQGMLETLAAQRREAAAAAASGAAGGHQAGSPAAAASTNPCILLMPVPSEGEANGWQSPLLQSPVRRQAGGRAPAAADDPWAAPHTHWQGVSTVLNNLRVSAAVSAPPPAASFWEMRLGSEGEGEAARRAAGDARRNSSSGSWSGAAPPTMPLKANLPARPQPAQTAALPVQPPVTTGSPPLQLPAPPMVSPQRQPALLPSQARLPVQAPPPARRLDKARWWSFSRSRKAAPASTTFAPLGEGVKCL